MKVAKVTIEFVLETEVEEVEDYEIYFEYVGRTSSNLFPNFGF